MSIAVIGTFWTTKQAAFRDIEKKEFRFRNIKGLHAKFVALQFNAGYLVVNESYLK